jgi:hypothetical protein
MAVITKYFSTNGTGDGSTYANRAALFNSGNWSTEITGVNYSNDTLICFVEPGTYTCNQTLDSSIFTNPPTTNGLSALVFIAAKEGEVWQDPRPDWNCCEPEWDTTDMPFIQGSGLALVTLGSSYFYGFNFESAIADALIRNASFNRCRFENLGGVGTLNNTAGVFGPGLFINSFIKMSSSRWNYGLQPAASNPSNINNVRISGVNLSTSGNPSKRGLSGTSNGRYSFGNICINNTLVGSSWSPAGNTSTKASFNNLTIDNCTTGISIVLGTNVEPGFLININDCIITNCTTGINSPTRIISSIRNRLRNTTNYNVPTNSIISDALNFVHSATNDEDYHNYTIGDLRPNRNSIIANTNIGAGTIPPKNGGGTYAYSYIS